jgi:serine/threonine-protein kinase
MIGTTILHYKILEKLGEGGMGVVYKARDLKLDRDVALKFLPPHLSKSPEDVERFQREAKALSTLNHPNIATIHDIEQPEGLKFLDLEYLPGGTLKTKVAELAASNQKLTLREVLDYARQILEGLAHAHKRGIIHRDLKTDNIMLTEDGRVKITDFGLAKFWNRPSDDQHAAGTIAYMSPEQVRNEEIDQRSDLFSFGVVFFELLTGRLPFRGEHDAALEYSILNENPLSPRSLRADVPADLENIVARCLEKDKSKRYQTADEILKDITRVGRSMESEFLPRKILKAHWVFASAFTVLAALAISVMLHKSSSNSPRSIAVLPFANLSDVREDEYFSRGITDDIITQLSKLSNLKVVSFSSAVEQRDFESKLENIKAKLDLAAILQGSVRKAGKRVRITTQLLDAQTSSTLWAETYERELKDLFQVQTEVANQIAGALQSRLLESEGKVAQQNLSKNPDAYNSYLQGRYFWNKRTEEGIRKSIEYFEQSVQQDAFFAQGHAGLADAYVVLASNTFAPPREVMPKAKNAATKALALDNTLAEAHASMAMVAFWYDWDKERAEEEFKKALDLNPNYATAHHWYAWYLAALGRSSEALREISKARELEPLSLIINTEFGAILYFTGQYEEEIQHYRQALEMDPNFALAHLHLGFAYLSDGNHDDALRELTTAVKLSNANPTMIAALGSAYAEAGKLQEAEQMLLTLKKLAQKQYVSPSHIAGLCASLGKTDEAFTFLEKAYSERSVSLVWIKMGRGFASLRGDPRFVKFLSKISVER